MSIVVKPPFELWLPDDPRAVTAISWTHRSNNPAVGCRAVDDGCADCWASNLVATRMAKNPSLPAYRHFWFDLSDIFYERLGPTDDACFTYAAACFGAAALSPQHQHQFLTHRPARARLFFDWLTVCAARAGRSELDVCLLALAAQPTCRRAMEGAASRELGQRWTVADGSPTDTRWPLRIQREWPLSNVHLGFSAPTAKLFAERWDIMRDLPNAVPWVSYEPAFDACDFGSALHEGLAWVVIGGQSKMVDPVLFDMAGAKRALDACEREGRAFFMKQGGTAYARAVGLKGDPKAEKPESWPADVQRREFPAALGPPPRAKPKRVKVAVLEGGAS